MKWLGYSGSLLCGLLVASQARAQGEDPDRARVVIDGGSPTVELRLTRQRSDETLLRCSGRCAFIAPIGRYRVFARDTRTGAEYELGLRVRRSSEFRLQLGDATASASGMALGIAGPFVFASGVVMVFHGAISGSEGRGRLGLGVMLAGAIMTPIGWVMYGQNRTKLELVDREASARARFRVGVGGFAPGALGLAGVAHF